MKYAVWAVLGLLFVLCVGGGCVSKQDAVMLRDLRASWIDMGNERARSLQALYDDRRAVYKKITTQKEIIMVKLDAGDIPIAEAEQLIRLVEREGEFTLDKIQSEIEIIKDDFTEQKKITDARIIELEAKGYKWWQILGGVLTTFAGGVLVDKKKLVGSVIG